MKGAKWAIEYVCFNTSALPVVPNQFKFHTMAGPLLLFVCAPMPWTWGNNSLKSGVIKIEYQRGLPPWFHETFRQKFQGLKMMKEGKLGNGLLGSTALIVQKSHQINTESHLQPFFSWAFQNGLSNENSEITKAPIRLYAHSFSSPSLKTFECVCHFKNTSRTPQSTDCLESWEMFRKCWVKFFIFF